MGGDGTAWFSNVYFIGCLLLRECFLLLKQTKDFQGSMQIAAFMFSITGVLIDSLINFPLRITPNAITFWYILGVTIASYSVYNNRVS